MATFGDSFKGKLGPLPVWAWGAIVGCVVVAYMWFNNNSDGGATDSADGEETASASRVYDAIDGAFQPSANGGSLATEDTPETVDSNTAWSLRAIAFLTASGVSPLTAQSAVSAYINGKSLTTAQRKMVDDAIVGIGQPPAVPDIPDAAATTYARYYRDATGTIHGVTSEGSDATLSDAQYISLGVPALVGDSYPWKYYTVNKMRDIATIAAHYKVSVERIQAMNRWKSIPEIKKGKKVKVPKL